MHFWGDDWSKMYEDDLYKAINYFTEYCTKYGLMHFFTKEKYGTMRLEYFYIRTDFDYLLGKNLIFIKNPKLHKFSKYVMNPIIRRSGLGWLIHKYQIFIFNMATISTMHKWPHLRKEVMHEYEFEDLLYEKTKRKVGYKCDWISYSNGDI